nr:reverse transcriptase domain-containing protein [Tanacetum cinerariifolium]
MEDLQLGVESYQKKLNLTRPDTYRSDLKRKEAYIAYSNPRGFIYQNKDKQNSLMRIDELHKFSDGTLTDVRTALDDRLKGIQIKYPTQSIWRKSDKDRATGMIQAIDKQLKTWRIMRWMFQLQDLLGHYDNHKRGRSTARSLYHPHQTVPQTDPTEPPPAPLQNKGYDLEVDNLALEGVAPELAPSDFVSQNYETLATLIQEETKKRSSQSLEARLNFDLEYEASPPCHRKERRERDSRRPSVFTRIGKKVVGDQTADLQYLGTHKNNRWRTNVHARLGSRDVYDRLGRRRSLSESPPSSNSEDSRRKRRKREDEDMSHPWRRQKVDTFTRRISDFSEDKRRRMPANVKTYDGTGDPDDHLKIFESTATIKNWPQPVWCHMFNSTLVGNARNWFSKLPRKSIDGFEELRRAFRLNFTQRKKCAKNPIELARVKQRQRESTSAYVER